MNGIHIIGNEVQRRIAHPGADSASREYFRSIKHLIIQVGEIRNESLMVTHHHWSNFYAI